MAHTIIPKFHNDRGVDVIEIGVKEFECVGASAPFDHPHVYLDMGDDSEIICPYCSTVYRYKGSLGPEASNPADALYKEYVEG
ncbi:zinc-finger domain-containing protein [Rhodoligotrophos defluvii]|uniref:zinc-finger domain-containing protein n=1 Tax=Rhodoligotrophos defluvii TaxID=2561934 RepID=UPI0010C9E246|nr:zinc-finger domain-containing protein [Rhodoligotrophos defluvii]